MAGEEEEERRGGERTEEGEEEELSLLRSSEPCGEVLADAFVCYLTHKDGGGGLQTCWKEYEQVRACFVAHGEELKVTGRRRG